MVSWFFISVVVDSTDVSLFVVATSCCCCCSRRCQLLLESVFKCDRFFGCCPCVSSFFLWPGMMFLVSFSPQAVAVVFVVSSCWSLFSIKIVAAVALLFFLVVVTITDVSSLVVSTTVVAVVVIVSPFWWLY